MTGYMKITCMAPEEARKAMGDENAAGFSVETRILHAGRADRVGLVMSVMQALEFNDGDRLLLLALMMDKDNALAKSMTIKIPVPMEEG